MKNRQQQPERAAAKLMALSLFLLICLVIAVTPPEPTAKAAKQAKAEKTHSTWVGKMWHRHQDDIEDAALAALLGGL